MGKELLDRPEVGYRLKQREIAEICVGQQPLQGLEFLGHFVHVADEAQNLLADAPEILLGQHTLLKLQVAEGEQGQRFVLVLQGVVVGFQQVLAGQLAVGVVHVPHHGLGVVRRLAGMRGGAEFADPQDVGDQHAVMRHRGAPGFADQNRRRHRGFLAHFQDGVDHVVGVFLQGIVDGGMEVGLRAVVVHSEAATDVEVAQRHAHFDQLAVVAAGFPQAVLDVADVRDLAAQVEVKQFKGVEKLVLLQKVDGLQKFARRQAEFGMIAARRLPAPAAAGRQPQAHADAGAHLGFLGEAGDQGQLARLFHHQDDGAPHGTAEQGGFDVFPRPCSRCR